MVQRYRYSGGEFIGFDGGVYEEWQGGQPVYFFKAVAAGGDGRWIFLFDGSRSISIKLPTNGGRSYIKWTGRWDDSAPWNEFHVVTAVIRGAAEPLYHVNSPRLTAAGKFSKQRAQDLSRTSCVLQIELASGVWHCFGSGTLIYGVVVLTAAHVLEEVLQAFPNKRETDLAVTFNYEYTAASAESKRRGTLAGNRPWARVSKVIESGSSLSGDPDYALLLVRWEPQGSPNPVTRVSPVANRAPILGENVLAVQHPGYFRTSLFTDSNGRDHPVYENPTQVSAGDVYAVLQAPFGAGGSNLNAYAFFKSKPGSSGGGVFDTGGNLIGVIGGKNLEAMSYFIQMDKIVERSRRLRMLLGLEPHPSPVPAYIPLPTPLLVTDVPYL